MLLESILFNFYWLTVYIVPSSSSKSFLLKIWESTYLSSSPLLHVNIDVIHLKYNQVTTQFIQGSVKIIKEGTRTVYLVLYCMCTIQQQLVQEAVERNKHILFVLIVPRNAGHKYVLCFSL